MHPNQYVDRMIEMKELRELKEWKFLSTMTKSSKIKDIKHVEVNRLKNAISVMYEYINERDQNIKQIRLIEYFDNLFKSSRDVLLQQYDVELVDLVHNILILASIDPIDEELFEFHKHIQLKLDQYLIYK